MVKWKVGNNSGDDFDFSEAPIKVFGCNTFSICLTKDEKYLLTGSSNLVSVFETTTRKITKEFKFTGDVRGINSIKDAKKALIS